MIPSLVPCQHHVGRAAVASGGPSPGAWASPDAEASQQTALFRDGPEQEGVEGQQVEPSESRSPSPPFGSPVPTPRAHLAVPDWAVPVLSSFCLALGKGLQEWQAARGMARPAVLKADRVSHIPPGLAPCFARLRKPAAGPAGDAALAFAPPLGVSLGDQGSDAAQ